MTETYRENETPPVRISTAASLLGVSQNTLRAWEDAGKIRSTRSPGGQRRYERAEIERVRRGEPISAEVKE